MIYSELNYRVPQFAVHGTKIRKSVQGSAWAPLNSYIRGPSALATAEKFGGIINLPPPSNKMLLIPYSKGNIGLYDMDTHTYTDGPTVPGSARFRGGCLHANTGIVVLAPLLSPQIGLYDTKTGEFRLGANVGASPSFNGAITSSVTGKVILIPGSGLNVGIYDPVDDKYTVGPAHGGTTSPYFAGGEELPNGDILLIPYSSGSFKIYDVRSNVIKNGPSGVASAAFHGSAKIHTGDVVCAPYSSNVISIYRWRSNTVYNVPCPTGGAKFRGAQLAPDGRVFFAPNTYDRIGWYDPAVDAYGEGDALGLGTTAKWLGINQDKNGEMVLAPYSHEFIGRFQAVASGLTPRDAMLSQQWNKQ